MSKIELDRNNKTLYGQIADILRERIMSGEFKPGDILPSERELAEEMQVSRIPVRALKSSKAPTNYFTPNILRKSWSRLVVSVVHLDALAFPVAAT